jgi:hypothetical protein
MLGSPSVHNAAAGFTASRASVILVFSATQRAKAVVSTLSLTTS